MAEACIGVGSLDLDEAEESVAWFKLGVPKLPGAYIKFPQKRVGAGSSETVLQRMQPDRGDCIELPAPSIGAALIAVQQLTAGAESAAPPRRAMSQSEIADLVELCDRYGLDDTPSRVVDDAQFVFLNALHPHDLIVFVREERLNQIYLEMDLGLPPQPPSAEYLRRIAKLGEKHSALGLCETVCAIRPGDVTHETVHQKLFFAAAPYLDYYQVKSSISPGYEYSRFVENMELYLSNFPWAVKSDPGAAQIILMGGGIHRMNIGDRIARMEYRRSDYDFCLITRDEDAAMAAVFRMHAWVSQRSDGMFIAWRTARTLTFVTSSATYQLRLRLYHTIEQALCSADVDCCAVGWDGERMFATERATRAITTQTNIAAPSRHSKSYFSRLLKWFGRRFTVAFPGVEERPIVSRKPGINKFLSNDLQNFVGRFASLASRWSREFADRVVNAEGESDYAPYIWDFEPPPDQCECAVFVSYLARCAERICERRMTSLLALTRHLGRLLYTPAAPPLDEWRRQMQSPDPDAVFMPAGAPASRLEFHKMMPLGIPHGSYNPIVDVSAESWYGSP